MSTKSELQYVRKEGRLKETSLDSSLSQIWSFYESIMGKPHIVQHKKVPEWESWKKKGLKKKKANVQRSPDLSDSLDSLQKQTENTERVSKQIKIGSWLQPTKLFKWISVHCPKNLTKELFQGQHTSLNTEATITIDSALNGEARGFWRHRQGGIRKSKHPLCRYCDHYLCLSIFRRLYTNIN